MLRHKRNNKEQNNKDRNQRILHVYSSQQSLQQLSSKAASLPLKKNTKPTHSHKPKDPPKKDKQKGQSSQPRIRPPEVYERIPVTFASSNSNSEIQFSSCGQTSGARSVKRHLYINVGTQSLLQEILQVDRRKAQKQQQSAVKIQKVFRGFLTRKLLQKYIQQYEEKLIAERNELKRKATFVTSQEDSFYAFDLKNSYFLSNKKLKSQQRPEFQEVYSNQSLIEDDFLSIQEPDFEEHEPPTRKEEPLEVDRSVLNQSSIAPQGQEVSLSFGQEGQTSPHFYQKPSSQIHLVEQAMESPTKEQKKTVGLSEDNTRDMYSHNISISPNYYRHNRSEGFQQNNLTSYQSEGLESEGYVARLKSSEKAKWEQVIEFVNENLKGPLNSQSTRQLFAAILDFSVKNREDLNKYQDQQSLVTPSTLPKQEEERPDFRKKGLERRKEERNQNMPLQQRQRQERPGRMSIFERTLVMKEYLVRSMRLEDEQVDRMMQLRESVLRRKQSDGLLQLNRLLEDKQLTQEQFLDRLRSLTSVFQQQKKEIEQTKEDIYNGYRAQLQLLKHTALDAKYLGCSIPFCRSMEIFPSRARWHFDSVMIDELDKMASRRRRRKDSEDEKESLVDFGTVHIDSLLKEEPEEREVFEKSQSEEDVSFNYEQTSIYEQPAEGSNSEVLSQQMRQVSTFQRGAPVAVFEEQRQSNEDKAEENLLEENSGQKSLRRELFKLQSDSESEEDYTARRERQRQILAVTDSIVGRLVWELLEQTVKYPKMLRHFRVRGPAIVPEAITGAERLQFLECCLRDLPTFGSVESRLNQKMYPNLRQMLFSMRECEDEEEDDEEYIQIGQYEYLLNQDICFDRIENFLDRYRLSRSKKKKSLEEAIDEDFRQQYQAHAGEAVRTYVLERQILKGQQLRHAEEERQENLRIELHMLFDVWNEEIIRERENKTGYSGIGLNELSLSLLDRLSPPMTSSAQYEQMMKTTQARIREVVLSEDFNSRISLEFQSYVCKNDSQWILYTQEALEYAFDLVKMVQIELIFECLHELHLLEQEREVLPTEAESEDEDSFYK